MGVYDRQIAMATRLIAKYGQECVWVQPGAVAPGGDPWNPQPSEEEPAEPLTVRIAWFAPRDVGRGTEEFIRALTGSEVTEGTEVGLLAGGLSFTPDVTDTVMRGNEPSAITKIDKLAPNGEPVLWFVTVKT